MSKSIIKFPPPYYNVEVSLKYPSSEETEKFIQHIFAYYIRTKIFGTDDILDKVHRITNMYSIKWINDWTLRVATSSDDDLFVKVVCFLIPSWISNRMFNHHIITGYIVRLSNKDIDELMSCNFEKIFFEITPYVVDNEISELSFLWKEMLDDICIKYEDELNYEIIYKSNGKKLTNDEKYVKYMHLFYDEKYYDSIIRKLIEEGIEIAYN
ncbi:hypothetical protein WAF17_19030 [Bernardetia sp. ABR2-2B]|uniref:hypothetical protein n=1 Tax=Bernardetia sp. ABR2-2B TaxID=3127472 RepID=UPI0030CD74CD